MDGHVRKDGAGSSTVNPIYDVLAHTYQNGQDPNPNKEDNLRDSSVEEFSNNAALLPLRMQNCHIRWTLKILQEEGMEPWDKSAYGIYL